MPQTTAQKLKIKEGDTLMTLHAPDDFKSKLLPLPSGVTVTAKAKHYQQIHWFVKDKAQMEAELNKILAMVKDKVICWIYYPKSTSKLQTNLARDKGWEALLQHQEIQWLSLISFDETWSAFGIRLKNEQGNKKAAQLKEKAIFQYIDAAKKIVHLPDDFAAALQQHPKQHDYFHALSFSHRKEYVEWIVSAKKEETRNRRIQEAVERLSKEWKNPANQ